MASDTAAAMIPLAALTLLFVKFARVNNTTVALSFMLIVLACSIGKGLRSGLIASVAGALLLDYYFFPPLGFRIADPEDWVALCAFMVSAVIASQLSATVKGSAQEAQLRQRETERLYALSRAFMLNDDTTGGPGLISLQLAQIFGFQAVAVFDRASGQVSRNGVTEIPLSDDDLRDACQGTRRNADIPGVCVLILATDGQPVGTLAVPDGIASATVLHAIANLTAITLRRSQRLNQLAQG